MSTSNSYNWTQTRDELINGALRILRVVDQGGSADANQIAEGSTALNSMIKSWQAKPGMIPLWQLEWRTITLTATDYTIALTNEILGITEAYIRASDVDTKVDIISYSEYNALTAKTTTGTPNRASFDNLLTPTLYLYPVPDNSTDVLHYAAITRLEDFDAATNTPDFDQKWFEAIKFNLAYKLSWEYGMPYQERLILKADAKELLDEAIGDNLSEGDGVNMSVSPNLEDN